MDIQHKQSLSAEPSWATKVADSHCNSEVVSDSEELDTPSHRILRKTSKNPTCSTWEDFTWP